MKRFLITFLILATLIVTGCSEPTIDSSPVQINSFEDCINAGNPVMESFPRQCVANGKSFTEKLNTCQTSDDCIPKPGCHPKECINKDFENMFQNPEVCTMIFLETAAYSKEDCECQNSVCTNKNLN